MKEIDLKYNIVCYIKILEFLGFGNEINRDRRNNTIPFYEIGKCDFHLGRRKIVITYTDENLDDFVIRYRTTGDICYELNHFKEYLEELYPFLLTTNKDETLFKVMLMLGK